MTFLLKFLERILMLIGIQIDFIKLVDLLFNYLELVDLLIRLFLL